MYSDEEGTGKDWDDWLKAGIFYVFGFVYMCSRIAMNATAVFIPLYIASMTSKSSEEGEAAETNFQVATVPLTAYTSSLLWSLFGQQWMNRKFESSRLIPLIIALAVTFVASAPFLFFNSENHLSMYVYPCVSVQGIGIALMLNTSVSLISDVIGTDNKSSAFVYGVYSLLDKFANGFILWWLVRNYSKDVTALRCILAIIPTLSALGCALMTWFGIRLYAD